MKTNFTITIMNIKKDMGIIYTASGEGNGIKVSFDYHSGYLPFQIGDVLQFTVFINTYTPLENQTCLFTGVISEVSRTSVLISFGGLMFNYEGDIDNIYENDKVYISIKKI
ncbi:hypothetical protein EBI_26019 [Enterocytozoon bieneusi H348]|nr:hypothetical protein EBI_26019 [Enterocytozoon bieneusi H348]|eukprot:XP_002649680.1 hypothetical protein EBI_26019 [Enterocytozoon bieneusi H348]